jgi:hypothetical protein
MSDYRDRLVPVGSAATVPDVAQAVQPTPTARPNFRPTRFNVPQSTLYGARPSAKELTIENEYRKYTSGEVASEDVDILWFWEV